MRKPATFDFLGLALLAVFAAGCDVATDDASTDDGGAPEFTEGQGQAPADQLAYPPAPYGFVKGAVAGNYVFYGYPDAAVDKTALVKIQLADFYNPTGDGVFPEGSPYGAGEPKPKALVIAVGSVWCGPCNFEAANELPPSYAKYQPLGGEILGVLADGATPGTAAQPKALNSWVTKYKSKYPSAIDPSYSLGELFVVDAFPQNIMIDLRTMEIVQVISGGPTEAFWATFEKLLQ